MDDDRYRAHTRPRDGGAGSRGGGEDRGSDPRRVSKAVAYWWRHVRMQHILHPAEYFRMGWGL